MIRLHRQWIGLGLLTLMLVKAWLIPLVCLDYELRKDYIAKTLCVNRDTPITMCYGKCYLAKKLNAASQQQERQAEQNYLASLIYQVMNTDSNKLFEYTPVAFLFLDTVQYRYQSSFIDRLSIGSIFRPPVV
ncbi:hypothetical protein MUK70_14310 [Dyadobacter chenwenxiniae]|uniref:Uncharacterized protein n=1 Tax=Dyadobacter chenwenxiniae TaxID=2906456 RepID=A0A9X1TD62_9BACT|nr:hypothetical protein [Dyadobacter chenwenxiniae]MCF0060414.1 hypothetical protein [Dyadobacter chenwenxiniae]UON86145.1 hypothetical protein MUK70_14310 [Dyadobacter chenwenxiniae]